MFANVRGSITEQVPIHTCERDRVFLTKHITYISTENGPM